jgi:hypothetical protein
LGADSLETACYISATSTANGIVITHQCLCIMCLSFCNLLGKSTDTSSFRLGPMLQFTTLALSSPVIPSTRSPREFRCLSIRKIAQLSWRRRETVQWKGCGNCFYLFAAIAGNSAAQPPLISNLISKLLLAFYHIYPISPPPGP